MRHRAKILQPISMSVIQPVSHSASQSVSRSVSLRLPVFSFINISIDVDPPSSGSVFFSCGPCGGMTEDTIVLLALHQVGKRTQSSARRFYLLCVCCALGCRPCSRQTAWLEGRFQYTSARPPSTASREKNKKNKNKTEGIAGFMLVRTSKCVNKLRQRKTFCQ